MPTGSYLPLGSWELVAYDPYPLIVLLQLAYQVLAMVVLGQEHSRVQKSSSFQPEMGAYLTSLKRNIINHCKKGY